MSPTRAHRRTKDVMLTVPLEPRHAALVRAAAEREDRSLSGWLRWACLEKLKELGLLDEDNNPIDVPQAEAS